MDIVLEDYSSDNSTEFNNYTNFYSDYFQANFEPLAKVARTIRNIFIPCIVLFGILGNTLSITVFQTACMKKSSSSVYLTALAIVDNLFLVSLCITWIEGEFWSILRFEIACECITFLTYVTSFLSVWFIVAFTADRFVSICFPQNSQYTISMFRTKVTVFGLVCLSVLLYGFSFWATETVVFMGRYRCVHKQEALPFLQVFTWADSVITIVLPFFLITFMNTKVLLATRNCLRASPRTSTKTSASIPSSSSSLETVSLDSVSTTPSKMKRRVRYKLQLRATKLLVLVSTIFLVFNLPSHVMRFYNLITLTVQGPENQAVSIMRVFLQELSLLFYYSAFSFNFILYTSTCRNFKRTLKGIFKCCSRKHGSYSHNTNSSRGKLILESRIQPVHNSKIQSL